VDKVSIVIPVYNCQRYIRESINSALNQDYPNLEIIVVDDGSTDNTPLILMEYADKIKVITKKNGHTGSALNAGIRAMTGDWFKELQADDRLLPDCVSKMLRQVKNKRDTIYYAHVTWIDEEGKTKFTFATKNLNDISRVKFNSLLLLNNIGNGTSVLIHKSAFKKHGLFDEVTKHEDYEMRLRWCLLENCRMKLIEETVAEYRIHPEQYTQSRTIPQIIDEDKQIKSNIVQKLTKKEQLNYADIILRSQFDPRQHQTLYQERNLFKVLALYHQNVKDLYL